MAPREATGTFPDQFLTFDYDALPLNLPPQQHEAAPILNNNEPLNNNEQPPVNPSPNASNTSTAELAASGETTVDPLSIDPTVVSHSPTNNNNNDYFPNQTTVLQQQTTSRSMTSGLVGRSFTVRPSVEPPTRSLAQQQQQPNHVRASVSPSTDSLLSSGSSLLLHPPHSPTSFSSFRSRTRNVQSVLDTANSMDSDDDQDDDHDDEVDVDGVIVFDNALHAAAPPPLDSTFVSDSTSTPSPTRFNSSHQQHNWSESSGHMVSEEDLTKQLQDVNNHHTPSNVATNTRAMEHNISPSSSMDSNDSLRMIYRNTAFDGDEPQSPMVSNPSLDDNDNAPSPSQPIDSAPPSPNSIMLTFGPNTTVADLKYFAERGCIVPLLQALKTPRLVTLGTRMLADYAKMSHRRAAVASNRRILEFVQSTMLQVSQQADWLGREYAVETIRSLTATEESDPHLMSTHGLLSTLSLVARGGPFVSHVQQENGVQCTVPLASEKARLHACIAIMNLSCGKANKIEIAKIPDVLEAMRTVMLNSAEEPRLKATTCIKNLSNADANDTSLLGTPGLLEALSHVASVTCHPQAGSTTCTTNACLALMNLSISKANKHRVFRTPGVMDSLMTVLAKTTAHEGCREARVKACSALSNLAIGYDNKIPMFHYPGFVDCILNVIRADTGEARTKACSILWSFAAEMKNQVPVVQRGDILPVLVHVAEEDGTTEARFKCVAALTLLAESLDNAIPLLESGALTPLMEILHDAGPDPTQWKGQTASWCVGFLMNIAQSDEAVPALREAGVVELLAPLLTLDHYQSLKAAMAVTFCCRYDEGDECYDLLRKTENVIPKIISLLHNTLSGRGGNGYKYGVFTLRSSVGCIDALASGPDFMKERIATGPVFESLLRVVHDFCVDGGTPGAIVGGGRDDALSATLAVRALQSLTEHLIPIAGSSALPFGRSFEDRLLLALHSFANNVHQVEIKEVTRQLATDAKIRIQGGRRAMRSLGDTCHLVQDTDDVDMGDVASMASNCCGFQSLPGLGEDFLHALALPTLRRETPSPGIVSTPSIIEKESSEEDCPIRTFLLADSKTGRRFVVPSDPTGGRKFNDTRVWCYRRGRFCKNGEEADPNYVWSAELQQAYEVALSNQPESAVSDPPAIVGTRPYVQ